MSTLAVVILFVAALALAVREPGRGVFNVAGEGACAWSWAIRHAGASYVSVPHVVAIPLMAVLYRGRGVALPEHLIDYFRYPVIIDDQAFRERFGYTPRFSTVDALRGVRGLA